MKKSINHDAAVRSSFIDQFAFGDKSAAIRSLIQEAHSTDRSGDFTEDGYYQIDIAPGIQRLARAVRMSA